MNGWSYQDYLHAPGEWVRSIIPEMIADENRRAETR